MTPNFGFDKHLRRGGVGVVYLLHASEYRGPLLEGTR